jgi:ABC-type uncharacterized transport system permease subunit
MPQLVDIAFYLGVVAYSAAATLFFVDLARREGAPVAARWAPRTLGAGAVLHGVHVVTASLLSQVCPVNSIHFGLSLSALIAVVVYLGLRTRRGIHALGAFIAPAALTFLVGAQFVGEQHTEHTPGVLLAVHVSASVLGMGMFLLAGAAGLFYLVQERRLKDKRAGWFGARLPALDALDVTEHRLLSAGFLFLTFGLVTGAIFAGGLSGASSGAVVRASLAYATWLLVAGVLLLREVAGWRGRRAAYGTIAGAVCLLLVILLYAVRPVVGA